MTALAAAAAASVAGGAGLEAAEKAIRAGLLRLGASVLEDLLAADAGYAGPRLDCGAGHVAVFAAYRDKNADTVLGPVTIGRAWYHCADCGHGFAPRDEQLGVAGQTMSPGLRKMTARAAAAVPFAAAARLVGELAGITLTGRRAGRRAEADGNAAAAVIEAGAAAVAARAVLPMPPAGPLPGKLYAAIDGTGIPMTAAETEGRAGKGEDGRARTREVKMAAVFTQTAVDEQGYPVRDPGSSSYLATLAAAPAVRRADGGRGPPPRRRAHPPAHHPGRRSPVDLEPRHRAFSRGHPDRRLVSRPRARPRAGEPGRAAAGRPPRRLARRPPRRTRRRRLAALIAAGQDLRFTGALASERDKALHYFQTNAHRMRYAWYRSLGLFVGSGVVEAGCKSVIGQRLKLSGMRWTEDGATGILTLRCLDASNRWEETWQPASRTRAA